METIEAERVYYLFPFNSGIYRKLDGESLFQSAVKQFVHSQTVIDHKTIVSPISFNIEPSGLLFSALVVPGIKLENAQFDENLSYGRKESDG